MSKNVKIVNGIKITTYENGNQTFESINTDVKNTTKSFW
jgi:hypothetical protein